MEKSFIWTCVDVGDGGINSFSMEVVMTWLGTVMTSFSPETAGVIPWQSTNTDVFEILGLGSVAPTGMLRPTYSGGNLSIDSGLGIAGGIFYINTEPRVFNVAALKSGFASASDRIVLRREILSQTARLAYVPATADSTTAPLSQNIINWDVPIARVNLDGSGNYVSLTDDRLFATSPMASRLLIYEGVVSETNPIISQPQIGHDVSIPGGFKSLEMTIALGGNRNVQIRFNGDTANNYYPAGNPSTGAGGITLATGTNSFPAVYDIRLPFYNRNSFPLGGYVATAYPFGSYIFVDGAFGVPTTPAFFEADRIHAYYPGVVSPIESVQIYTVGTASTMSVPHFSLQVYGVK